MHPSKEARAQTKYKRKHKRRYRAENPACFFSSETQFCSLSVLDLLRLISLGLLVWNFYQTFAIVCIEFWLRFEPEIRLTRFAINFLFITVMAERKVRLCVKLFEYFSRWILIRLTWNLSRFVPNSVKIPTWNFNKKLFCEKFSKILCKPRLSILFQNLWNFALLSAILF